MIDFHTHLLPDMDDGAENLEISRKLLSTYNADTCVVATPHYYPADETIESFLERRDKALKAVADSKITLLPGAEVYLSPEITKMEGIERLAIGDSGCILLELPYESLPPWIEPFLFSLIAQKNLTPILAHAERYFPVYNDFSQLRNLLKMDLYVQINADSLLAKHRKRTIDSLQKRNMIHVLGSDCHNMADRPNRIAQAREELLKSYGAAYVDMLDENAAMLLRGEKPEKQVVVPKRSLFSFLKR